MPVPFEDVRYSDKNKSCRQAGVTSGDVDVVQPGDPGVGAAASEDTIQQPKAVALQRPQKRCSSSPKR